MFLFVCTGGLMTTGNLSQIAKSLNVFDAKICGLAIVPFTATLTGVTNAFSRIMWGSISDRIGREYTMTLAFGVEGRPHLPDDANRRQPRSFVLLLPFVFLSWGEIYALFSAITGDVFGPKNATANYGIFTRPKASRPSWPDSALLLMAAYFAGSFIVPYYIAAVFDAIAAILAFFALRPLIRGRINREVAQVTPAGAAT